MADRLIAVVGAGAAGLGAALELRDRGARVLLFESSDRAGGKLSTIRENGFLIERSALGVLDRKGDFAPLCKRLGIEPIAASKAARARFVERAGKIHRLASPLALATGALLSFREQISLAAEPLRSQKAAPGAGESITSFFSRRLGKAGPFLGELLQTGIYAGDAGQLEMDSCFPEMARLEREHGSLVAGSLASLWSGRGDHQGGEPEKRARPRLASFAEGMETLPLAMARALGDSLRLNAEVRAIRPRSERGFLLSIDERGAASEFACDGLILALPAPRLASLCAPFDQALAAGLAPIDAVPIAQVHLGVREADLKSKLQLHKGFGLLAPGRSTIGTLFPAALWPNRAPEKAVLISVLVGGAHFPNAPALEEKVLVEQVRAELQASAGLVHGAQFLYQRVVRWSEAVPQYRVGHAKRLAAIDARVSSWKGLQLTGSWLRGVSVLDCLRDGRRTAQLSLAGC